MDWLTGLLSVGGGITLAFIAITAIVIGLPVFLHHRRRMAQLSGFSDEKVAALRSEIETLRKRCETLESDILVIHEQMADETRVLDRKLNSILPGDEPENASKAAGPSKDNNPVQGDERVRA